MLRGYLFLPTSSGVSPAPPPFVPADSCRRDVAASWQPKAALVQCFVTGLVLRGHSRCVILSSGPGHLLATAVVRAHTLALEPSSSGIRRRSSALLHLGLRGLPVNSPARVGGTVSFARRVKQLDLSVSDSRCPVPLRAFLALCSPRSVSPSSALLLAHGSAVCAATTRPLATPSRPVSCGTCLPGKLS